MAEETQEEETRSWKQKVWDFVVGKAEKEESGEITVRIVANR